VGIGLLLLAASAVGLLVGAELFAEHAAAAGRRLGVSALAVGVLLAGAEPEELITAITAGVRDRPGIGIGDAIGANLTMLTLTLGLAATAHPVPLRGPVRVYAAGATVAGLSAAAVLADGQTSRIEGAVLVVVYAGLVAAVWWRERTAPAIGELAEVLEDDDGHDSAGEAAAVGLVLAVVGIAVMAGSGSLAVEGAERVIEALSVSDTAVGLTLVGFATTAELLALVWAAARRDISELAVAAIVGSVAYNATATLGAAALTRPATGLDVRTAAGGRRGAARCHPGRWRPPPGAQPVRGRGAGCRLRRVRCARFDVNGVGGLAGRCPCPPLSRLHGSDSYCWLLVQGGFLNWRIERRPLISISSTAGSFGHELAAGLVDPADELDVVDDRIESGPTGSAASSSCRWSSCSNALWATS
jgi:cation:H+ antiporter